MTETKIKQYLRIDEKYMRAIYLVLAAFFIILLASRSSFLYPCNNWNDANSYFSVGKALFNGKMPYRDVFDQKGMYLYFFYGLAYLTSHTTFAGVFVMEIILAAFDLFGICRILELYVKRSTALILSPLVLAVAFSSNSFYWGGSAEEVCFPFMIWALYYSLDYFKNHYSKEKMSLKLIFINGILAGMAANIKFTVLGFFFAWMMCIAFSFLAKKDFWGAVKGCLVYLAGMAITFIPWLIYFGVQGSLYEWYWGYVFINVFVYSDLNEEGPTLGQRVYTLGKLLYWVIRKNLIYFAFVIPGVLWDLLGFEKPLVVKEEKVGRFNILKRFNIFALCFFLFLGIYVGGSELPYYALPLAVFTVLGFAFLGQVLEWIIGRIWSSVGEKAFLSLRLPWLLPLLCSLVSIVISMGIIWTTSMNISYMSEKREDLFLYKFKEVMEETPNPTLLNIGCLDAGLYTVCDIVPTCRWFQTQTLHIDDVEIEQERYIREGMTDYVIARDAYPEVIWEKYELVTQELWYQGDMEFTYYLFRRKQ